MSRDLISVILPAYNVVEYVGDAIRSVLAQEHGEWELLVVNDGSTDGTDKVIRSFEDPRIKVFDQVNMGIGGARNTGLENTRGNFICFLDGDDVLPPKSLSSRLQVFRDHPDTDFVDGSVQTMDADLRNIIASYEPNFVGDPFIELIKLSGRCFFGNTWLMKWDDRKPFRFWENITHAEDLQFYIGQARGKTYRYTDEIVLLYRRRPHSSMKNLEGLYESYQKIGKWLISNHKRIPIHALMTYHMRYRFMMAGAYKKTGNIKRAFRVLWQ